MFLPKTTLLPVLLKSLGKKSFLKTRPKPPGREVKRVTTVS